MTTPGPSRPAHHGSAAESPVPLPAEDEVSSSSVGQATSLHTKPLRSQWISQNGRRLPDTCMVDRAIWPFVWRCRPGRNYNPSMVRVKDLQQIATWIEESTLEQQMGPQLLQVPGRVGVRTQIYHHRDGRWALFTKVPDLCDNKNIPVWYCVFGERQFGLSEEHPYYTY
ncbi:Deoxyribose-phosphate aldolase [Dissostichus eleginoides]|uniref:Deoxyribose-phosphate aldolase n=1 Tax=Dissostichus eleginoides TaxID=100907 RepID=A0AAD9BVF5_DISEL|nr:Deoxyribose-phosphate aldolase [Dissostichus eleginoides]